MVKNTFTCYKCEGVFEKGLSDEEAKVQFEREFPDEVLDDSCELLCDDCFQELLQFLYGDRS